MAKSEKFGLEKQVLHPVYGVPMMFHVPTNITQDLINKTASVTFGCYFNKQVYDGGMQPMHYLTIPVLGDETASVSRETLQAIVAAENDFKGATLSPIT